MVGHLTAIYLQEHGHDVTGFARRELTFLKNHILGDATDIALLNSVVRCGYDIVINCVGVLNEEVDNNTTAVWINGKLPHVLAEMTEDLPTRVFHISTDCVFAGNTGPYTEDSIPDGTSAYDRTKAAGELNDNKNLTFRNSIVGPDINPNGIGLLNWFMGQKKSVKGFTGAIWTGLTTLELAKAMEHEAAESASGLVNMVPGVSISKFDLLNLFNDKLRASSIAVVPDNTLRLDKTLVRTNFQPSFMPKDYSEQVSEMAVWIREHRNLYPHYEVK